MAIAPIDLQTLFTQMDKVGKTQASQKEGQPLQQAVQNVHIQKKADEQIQQVNQAQSTGDGPEKINDHSKQGGGEGKKKDKDQKEAKREEKNEEAASVLSDLNLGRKIDISL